jgi:hypothetical protein
MLGGIVVGMTSVGSGSLMIILLLFLYPMLGANQLVGTDPRGSAWFIRSRPWEGASRPRNLEAADITPQPEIDS